MKYSIESGIIRILKPDGTTVGTGFLVSKQVAITCVHVVERAEGKPGGKINIQFHAENASILAVVHRDGWFKEDDIAILALNYELPQSVHPLELQPAQSMLGHRFSVFGYPEENQDETRWSQGYVHGLVKLDDYAHPVLQIQGNEVDKGLSGSPLIDQDTNRVFGILTAYRDVNRPANAPPIRIAYAIPIETAWDKFSALKNIYLTSSVEIPEKDGLKLLAKYHHAIDVLYSRPDELRVSLNVSRKSLREYFVSAKLIKDATSEDKTEGEQKYQTVQVNIVLSAGKKLWIWGQAGTGKSTLLKYIALNSLSNYKSIGLQVPHIPLLIPLRRITSLSGNLEHRLADSLSMDFPSIIFPKDFLTSWSSISGYPWLIMLDGVDEIPPDERNHIVQWLVDGMGNLPSVQMIITSRPLTTDIGILRQPSEFSRYELLPLDEHGIRSLSETIFDSDVDGFYMEFKKTLSADIQTTPLILNIAAKLYSGNPKLPAKRVELLENLTRFLLADAEKRGLGQNIDARIVQLSRQILGRAAMVFQESQRTNEENRIIEAIVAYLKENLRLSRDVAEIEARKIIHSLSQFSGFFIQRTYGYEFIHPIFQEYFVAVDLIRLWGKDSKSGWRFVSRRINDKDWSEILLITIALLDIEGIEISSIISELNLDFSEHVDFLVNLLFWNVDIGYKLQELEEYLIGEAQNSWYYSQAADHLARLGRGSALKHIILNWEKHIIEFRISQVIDLKDHTLLYELGLDSEFPLGARVKIISGLLQLGAVQEARRVCDSILSTGLFPIDQFELEDLVPKLKENGLEEQFARIVVILCGNTGGFPETEPYIAFKYVPDIEDLELQATACVAIILNKTVRGALLDKAMDCLKEHQRYGELVKVVENESLEFPIRYLAGELLDQESILKTKNFWLSTIVNNNASIEWKRKALKFLYEVGQVEAIAGLLERQTINDRLEYDAINYLIEISSHDAIDAQHYRVLVLSHMRNLVLDPEAEKSLRSEAVSNLGRLEDYETLHSIVNNPSCPLYLRVKAAGQIPLEGDAILENMALDPSLQPDELLLVLQGIFFQKFGKDESRLIADQIFQLAVKFPYLSYDVYTFFVTGRIFYNFGDVRNKTNKLLEFMIRDPHNKQKSLSLADYIHDNGIENSVDLLYYVAFDSSSDEYDRYEAISKLETLESAQELVHQAWKNITAEKTTSGWLQQCAGFALLKLGDENNAVVAWLRALSLPGRKVWVLRDIANELINLKDRDGAAKLAKRIIQYRDIDNSDDQTFISFNVRIAASLLVEFGRFHDLLQFAQDVSIPENHREAILQTLFEGFTNNHSTQYALPTEQEVMFALFYSERVPVTMVYNAISRGTMQRRLKRDKLPSRLRGLIWCELLHRFKSDDDYLFTIVQGICQSEYLSTTAAQMLFQLVDKELKENSGYFDDPNDIVIEDIIIALRYIDEPNKEILSLLRKIALNRGVTSRISDAPGRERLEAILSLYGLGEDQTAFEGLSLLLKDEDEEDDLKASALEKAGKLKLVDFLRSVMNGDNVYQTWIKINSASILVNLGFLEEVRSIAKDVTKPLVVRLGLANIIQMHESIDWFLPEMEVVLCNNDFDFVHREVLELLAKIGKTSNLASIVWNPKYPMGVRVMALNHLIQQDNHSIILKLTNCNDEEIVSLLIGYFSRRKNFDVVLKLARANRNSISLCRKAITSCEQSNAIATLQEFANDSRFDESISSLAKKTLIDMGIDSQK